MGGVFLILSFGNYVSAGILDDQTLSRLDKLELGDVDSECLLDLLNDRFGLQLGDPLNWVGGGLNALSGGLDSVGQGIQEASGFTGGDPRELDFGQALGAGVGGAVRGVGDITGAVGDGLGAVGGAINGIPDINNIRTKDVLDIFFPGSAQNTVFDGPGSKRGARIVRCHLDRGLSTQENLISLILGWTKLLLSIAAIAGVVAGVWAGFSMITAFGSDRIETAKKTLLGVIAGVLLILGAYAIVNTFLQSRFGPIASIPLSSPPGDQEQPNNKGDNESENGGYDDGYESSDTVIGVLRVVGGPYNTPPGPGRRFPTMNYDIEVSFNDTEHGAVESARLFCEPSGSVNLCDFEDSVAVPFSGGKVTYAFGVSKITVKAPHQMRLNIRTDSGHMESQSVSITPLYTERTR